MDNENLTVEESESTDTHARTVNVASLFGW
jgi:hypothetical protein